MCVEECWKGKPVIDQQEWEGNVTLLSLTAHTNTVPIPVALQRMLSRAPTPIGERATPKCGIKIRSGYLTPTVSGAQKWAKWLHNPCLLGGPQRQARGRNEKWLLDHYRLVGPYRIGYGMKCTICERKRPKKENVVIKQEKKWCVWGKQYAKSVWMYAALFRLYSGIITQNARRRHRKRRRGSVPIAPGIQFWGAAFG